MSNLIKIEAFIVAQAKEKRHVRLTIELDGNGKGYTARLVDQYYEANIAMLDINGQHYLLAQGNTIEDALEGLAHAVELQYC
jgi:hypothetical protein